MPGNQISAGLSRMKSKFSTIKMYLSTVTIFERFTGKIREQPSFQHRPMRDALQNGTVMLRMCVHQNYSPAVFFAGEWRIIGDRYTVPSLMASCFNRLMCLRSPFESRFPSFILLFLSVIELLLLLLPVKPFSLNQRAVRSPGGNESL